MMDLHSEFTKFLKELKDYKEILTNMQSKSLNSLVQEKRETPILSFSIRNKSDETVKKEIIEDKREKLVSKHGVLKDEIGKLVGQTNSSQFSKTWNRALSPVFGIEENKNALSLCIDYTLDAIGRLDTERKAAEQSQIDELFKEPEKAKKQPSSKSTESLKAFIAHEGETRALNILKEFLEALGIQYFIAESKASDGRSIEKQVDWTQSKADFAICLATKGKAINRKTGKHYMGLNVADELGRARQVYGNHIILLVQKGVEVHTNPREIVHETFTTTNMERAFIKIVKELTNWGFILVGTIKESSS